MAKPDIILIGGHAYSWQEVCELRRKQLEAWKASQLRQLALFELKDDSRPVAERTAAGRYREPTLFSVHTECDLGKETHPISERLVSLIGKFTFSHRLGFDFEGISPSLVRCAKG